MPALKLYVDFFSQPCRAVIALCQLKKISIQIIELRVNKKQHLTEHFKTVNPLQMVPALQDQFNHISMGQSQTIMRYLSRRFENQRSELYPIWDIKRVVKIDQYLDYHHIGVRAKLFSYILNTVLAAVNNKENSTYNIDQGKQEVQKSLKILNDIFLREKYIVGDQMSIADLSAYYEVNFLSLANYNFAKWSKLNEWINQMEQTPQINKVNENFIKMAEKIKSRLDQTKLKEFII